MSETDYTLGLNLTQLRSDVAQAKAEFRSIGDSSVAESKRMMESFRSIGSTITGALSVAALTSFGKQLVDITGQFQTFQAVLTNTFGDATKAKSAMTMIQDFAATTPFQVDALTNSFVKLANQGFTPTYEQMTLLGDLASSTGKGFDQLTEAIIDAQTGEFERLKEFGIRASKEGENVTFTFKEQQTQVDFTASSIRDYILSLGELEGVQGANAAIAATLTGQVSNLQDGITQMMNEIGQSSEGALSGAISSASYLVDHYEEVGRILGVLITSYGTYKAAIIAYAAVQKAANVAGSVKAFIQLTSAVKSAKDAQLLLNMAVGANPYIKLASILMTVGGLMWAFSKNSKSATEELTGLKKALADAGVEFDKEASKVKALQSIVENGNIAYDERKRALNELKGIVPGYNADLTNEGVLTNNNTSAIKEYLVQLEKQIKMKAAQEELEEAYRKKREQEKAVDKAQTTLTAAEDNVPQTAIGEAGINAQMYALNKVRSKSNELSDAKKELEETNKIIEELTSEIETNSNSVGSSGSDKMVKTLSDQIEEAALKITSLKTQLAGLKNGTTESDDYATDIETIQKALKEAEDRYNLLLGIDTKGQQKIADKKAENEAQAARELQALQFENRQAEIDLLKDGSDKKIQQIQLNYDKEIAAISAQEAKWKEAQDGVLKEEQTSEINKAKQSAKDKSILETTAVSEAEVKVSKDKFNALLEQYQTFDQQRRSIEDSYAADMAILNTELQKLQTEGKDTSNIEGTISVRTTEYESSIKQLKSDILQSTEFYQKLFTSISDKGYIVLKDFYKEAKNVIEGAVASGDSVTVAIPELTEDGSIVEKQVKITVAEYQKMVDQLESMGDELESDNPFKAVYNSFSDMFKAVKEGDMDAFSNSMESLQSAVDSTVGTMSQWGDSLETIFGDTVGQAFDEIVQLTEGVLDFGLGIGQIATGDIVGGITSVLSGVASIVQSLTSWREKEAEQQRNWYLAELELNRLIEERNLALAESRSTISDIIADTEALAWLVENGFAKESSTSQWSSTTEALSTAIDSLENEISRYDELWAKVQSSNAEWSGKDGSLSWYSVTQSLKDMSEAEIELYYEQGKLTDEAEAYYEAWVASGESIEELTSTIEELYSSMQEMVMGVSFDSWLSSAKDTLQAMQSDISDLADFTEETLQNAILNAFMYQALSDVLEPLYNELSEAFINGSVDSSFINDWKERFEEAMTDASEDLSALSEALGVDLTDSDSRTSATTGSITASQDSVDELSGRATAIQGHTYIIAEKITEIASAISSMIIQPTESVESSNVITPTVDSIDSFDNIAPMTESIDVASFLKDFALSALAPTNNITVDGVSSDSNSGSILSEVCTIGEDIQRMRDNSSQILEVVTGIKDDTAHLGRLEAIEESVSYIGSIKKSLRSIESKGLKVK